MNPQLTKSKDKIHFLLIPTLFVSTPCKNKQNMSIPGRGLCGPQLYIPSMELGWISMVHCSPPPGGETGLSPNNSWVNGSRDGAPRGLGAASVGAAVGPAVAAVGTTVAAAGTSVDTVGPTVDVVGPTVDVVGSTVPAVGAAVAGVGAAVAAVGAADSAVGAAVGDDLAQNPL